MKFSVLKRVQPAAILDGLTTAVITLDHALRVTYLNPAGESLFGVSRHHVLGQPLVQAIAHFAEQEPRLRNALDTGTGFIDRELRVRRPGEEPITVDCTVTPWQAANPGLLMEILALDRHLRISRDELLLAQHQASRELVRGLAHEIKNPLGGIRGAAQLLEREYPDSALREYTHVIIREADRLQNLVDRMLGPNRLPHKSMINVHEVIEHVRQLIEAEAGDEVAVVRDYDPSLPDVQADREQLIQAVLNVARNALQAVGAGGAARAGERATIMLRSRMRRQFTIGGHRHRLCVQIDIEDNGPGVPAAMIDKIFYPMVTSRADGTGLGLPISQYLIRSHGGLIECQSQPGRTVFSIYLPVEKAK
ncbi:MAG: nitrogen regulation protein NR(II) [Nevskia sp.]|nr:nitrogen regulation protein NR(II) [Nevskia sp.]